MFRTRELKGSNNAAMRAFRGHEAHMPRAAGKTFAKSRVRFALLELRNLRHGNSGRR